VRVRIRRGGGFPGARALLHSGRLWLDPTANNAWALGAIGFVLLLIGAGLGKTFGLRRARSQRERLLDELYSRVATLDGSPLGALNASPESAGFRAPDRAALTR
jgi:hypothetical protein